MANLFLQDKDTVRISDRVNVFGSVGDDTLILANTAQVLVNSNVDRVQFDGRISDYQFAIKGTQLEVSYYGRLVATIATQDDDNGTQLVFSDETTYAKLQGLNQMTLYQKQLSQTAQYLLSSPVSGVDGESGNTLAKATDIAGINATITGSLTENDVDYFKVHADSGGVLKLNLTHPNGPGTKGAEINLSLLDSNDNVITKGNFWGDGLLEATVATSGDYYIKVEDNAYWGGYAAGIYSIDLLGF